MGAEARGCRVRFALCGEKQYVPVCSGKHIFIWFQIGCPETPRIGCWEGNPESGMRHVGNQGQTFGCVDPATLPSVHPALPGRTVSHSVGPGARKHNSFIRSAQKYSSICTFSPLLKMSGEVCYMEPWKGNIRRWDRVLWSDRERPALVLRELSTLWDRKA